MYFIVQLLELPQLALVGLKCLVSRLELHIFLRQLDVSLSQLLLQVLQVSDCEDSFSSQFLCLLFRFCSSLLEAEHLLLLGAASFLWCTGLAPLCSRLLDRRLQAGTSLLFLGSLQKSLGGFPLPFSFPQALDLVLKSLSGIMSGLLGVFELCTQTISLQPDLAVLLLKRADSLLQPLDLVASSVHS